MELPPPMLDSGSHDQAPPVVSVLHDHPLIPFTRFAFGWCNGCSQFWDDYTDDANNTRRVNIYIYGGYCCNELGCGDVVFHKECGKPFQEINHSSHPDHSLRLIIQDSEVSTPCSFCGIKFKVGYYCSICDFKLDLACARIPEPLALPANSYGHEHPLQLLRDPCGNWKMCKVCHYYVETYVPHYRCRQCEFVIHVRCVEFFSEYHSSHPQHPLKSLKYEVPHYADKKCLLCKTEFDKKPHQFQHHQLHHCDICNFSICRACMKNPPPVDVQCLTTHEHQLTLIPRRIDFTCNACGTKGDRSPYFCLQCNFMIHRQCIDLPRVININRHDHRIAYNPRVGHGEWKCRVCRKNVNRFYGAYTCVKCPTLAVHSLCAIDKRVWDMVEREGTPEEEEILPPFEVIDDYTIKHFSHDHNLRINKDDGILSESTLCVACVFQICSEPFYACEECDFILHEKCAHLPRKKRHVRDNLPFTLHTIARDKTDRCGFCYREFTGFRYKSGSDVTMDVRCGSTSDSLEHESHQHPLYYHNLSLSDRKRCSRCRQNVFFGFGCSECNYFLDGECALLPKMVIKKRYDDHPLFLSFGEKNASGKYWCEACETKVNPKIWSYTCNECGIILHISCVVGYFSYIMPGSVTDWDGEVVSNNTSCRPLCSGCDSLCKLPSIVKLSKDVYFCSYECLDDDTLRKMSR